MRPGRRTRKRRALEGLRARGGVRALVDPQVEAGLRCPLGGWWTTRGAAWRKSRKTSAWGKGVRVLMVSVRSAAIVEAGAWVAWNTRATAGGLHRVIDRHGRPRRPCERCLGQGLDITADSMGRPVVHGRCVDCHGTGVWLVRG